MKKLICFVLMLLLLAVFVGCHEETPPIFMEHPSQSTASVPTSSQSTVQPVTQPSSSPVTTPSTVPTTIPTTPPVTIPTTVPTTQPTTAPTTKPTTPKPDDNIIAGGKWDASTVTWKITKDGVLTISGNRSIQGKPTYTWWDYKDIVTRIVVEDGITTIPDSCFKDMNKVTSVYLGNAIKSIGRDAFQNCKALTSVTIPVSTKTIDGYAFYGCTQLQTLDFAENCQLEIIRTGAFNSCGIRSLDVPDQMQTLEAESFANCFNLETVRLDGTLKEVAAYTFQNCTKLTDLYIGASITTGGTPSYILKDCTGLTKIENYSKHFRSFTDFPNLITLILGADIKESGRYENCPSLSSVTFLTPITKISSSAFFNCTSLKYIDIPDTVTVIETGAFQKSGLTEVTIPASVTNIGLSAFSDSALKKITFLGDCPTFVNNLAFTNVTATVYYPANNATWSKDVRPELKGNLLWVGV